jgi:hypothetical protein
MANKKQNPKRPRFLTFWLGLIFILNSVAIMIGILEYASAIHHPNISNTDITKEVIYSVLVLVAALLVWKWYKSGLYLLLFLGLISWLSYPTAIAFVYSLASVGIIYLAMRPAWNSFK